MGGKYVNYTAAAAAGIIICKTGVQRKII